MSKDTYTLIIFISLSFLFYASSEANSIKNIVLGAQAGHIEEMAP